MTNGQTIAALATFGPLAGLFVVLPALLIARLLRDREVIGLVVLALVGVIIALIAVKMGPPHL